MQLPSLFTVLAFAMTAAALPCSPDDAAPPRTDQHEVEACDNNNQPVCCNGGLLGILDCALAIVGGSCDGQSYCCSSNAFQNGVINVNLGCTKVH
ncbi:hypothetical protein VTK56DRAFT_4026 [Thermocarpiscus australiensis]